MGAISKADKRRIAANSTFLSRLRLGIAASNVIYLVVRLGLKSDARTLHYVAWAGSAFLLYVSHGLLKHALEPAFDAAGNLIFAGTDLSTGGVTSYAQDVAYLCIFSLAVSAVTDWAWLVMACVPVYAGYMGYTSVIGPYLASRKRAAAGAEALPDDEAARKRQAKKERQRARMEKFSVRR